MSACGPTAVSSVRRVRKLSADKLPSTPMEHEGRIGREQPQLFRLRQKILAKT